MFHWTTSDAIKEKPVASIILAIVLITAVYGGIGYLA